MAIDSHMHINSIVLEKVKISDYINEIINNPDIKSVINVGINIDTSNESLLSSILLLGYTHYILNHRM